MRFKEYLNEGRLKLKRVSTGYYEGSIGNIKVDVYKAESGGYWSSTIVVGKYGDDDWQEENTQALTKKEVIKDIETFIKRLK